MKTLCFKFHQNRAVNEEFYFWAGKILSGGREFQEYKGAEWPDFKISKNPYTEQWFQPTAKYSAF